MIPPLSDIDAVAGGLLDNWQCSVLGLSAKLGGPLTLLYYKTQSIHYKEIFHVTKSRNLLNLLKLTAHSVFLLMEDKKQ